MGALTRVESGRLTWQPDKDEQDLTGCRQRDGQDDRTEQNQPAKGGRTVPESTAVGLVERSWRESRGSAC